MVIYVDDVQKALREWSSKLTWVDADLRRDILPLIRFCQSDSVIRKAFVILERQLQLSYIDDYASGKMTGSDGCNTIHGLSAQSPTLTKIVLCAARLAFAGHT